jgi:NitT/TauT family transport system substrate-binding protein
MKEKTLGLVVLVLLALSLSSYAGYRLGYEEGRRSVTTVRMGYLVGDIHQIGCFVGRELELFEKEAGSGYRFRYLEYVNGPAEMNDFTAGGLDAGYVGVVPALIALSKGADLKIVASANLEGSALVARKGIDNVRGLSGKRVGTPGLGTIQDALLSMIENKEGITVTHVAYPGPSTLPLALEKGEIDGYIAWEPFCAEAVVNGTGQVVYTSHDILPNHQCCVFYVSGKLLREDRRLALSLLKAHLRAMEVVVENENRAMQIFSSRTGKSMDVIRESWKRMVWDPTPNEESIRIFAQTLIQAGKITGVENVEAFVKSALDLTLLEEAQR